MRPYRYLLAPPLGHVVLSFGGISYYRYGYLYYRPYWYDNQWVYLEVAPPAGLVVTQLPASPERVVINGQVYYRSGTTFYVEKPTVVATAPVEPALAAIEPVVTTPAAAAPAEIVPAPVAVVPAAEGSPADTAPSITQAPAGSTSPGPEAVVPGYVVTKPPIGALIESIPPGAKTVTSGGVTYFHADDVYYLPITVSGKTQYVVVQKPK